MAGSWTAFAHSLFVAGLFFTILVLPLPHLFLGLPFAVSWWAYTFPLDAMTSAALAYHAKIGRPASGVIAAALLSLTSAVVAVVSARTGLALQRGELFGR